MTELRLPFEQPYHAGSALRYFRLHALPGAEIAATGTHTRVLDTASGPVAVTVRFERGEVVASHSGPPDADIAPVLRRWLDLDAEPSTVEAALRGGLLDHYLDTFPGVRVLSHPSAFEATIMTVLGQQVSLAAARTFGGRLVAAFGSDGPEGLRRFPTPQRLADAPDLRERVGLTNARARTVTAVAERFADGYRLDDPGDLLDIPGIGPWTVEYLALRVAGDRDAFPSGDLVIRRQLSAQSAAEALAAAQEWRPYRAYAACLLWAAA